MKIDKGNKRFLADVTDLPDVSCGVASFFQKMNVDVLRKEPVDGYVQETKTTYITEGVRQPLSPSQLALKPEGQRTWRFSKLHCLPNLRLQLDDIVILRDVQYRVMALNDYSEYGYMEYDLSEGFQ